MNANDYRAPLKSIEEEKLAALYAISAVLCFGFNFEMAAGFFAGIALLNAVFAIISAWTEVKNAR